MDSLDLTFVRCPSCRSLVPAISTRCRMCGASLETSPSNDAASSSSGAASSSSAGSNSAGSSSSSLAANSSASEHGASNLKAVAGGGTDAGSSLKRFDTNSADAALERSASVGGIAGEDSSAAAGEDPLSAYVESVAQAGSADDAASSSEEEDDGLSDSDELDGAESGSNDSNSDESGSEGLRAADALASSSSDADLDSESDEIGDDVEAVSTELNEPGFHDSARDADQVESSNGAASNGSGPITLKSPGAKSSGLSKSESNKSDATSEAHRNESQAGRQSGGFEARKYPHERRYQSPESGAAGEASRRGAAGAGHGGAGQVGSARNISSGRDNNSARSDVVAQGGNSGNVGGGNVARRMDNRPGAAAVSGNAAVARGNQSFPAAQATGNAAAAAQQQGARATRETPVFGTGKLVGWMVSYADTRGSSVELREGKFFVTAKSIKEHDLVLDDRSVSTPHALVTCGRDGGLLIQDLMSDRGVFVRRRGSTQYRQEEEAIPVEHGDWVRFGDLEFLIVLIPAGAE